MQIHIHIIPISVVLDLGRTVFSRICLAEVKQVSVHRGGVLFSWWFVNGWLRLATLFCYCLVLWFSSIGSRFLVAIPSQQGDWSSLWGDHQGFSRFFLRPFWNFCRSGVRWWPNMLWTIRKSGSKTFVLTWLLDVVWGPHTTSMMNGWYWKSKMALPQSGSGCASAFSRFLRWHHAAFVLSLLSNQLCAGSDFKISANTGPSSFRGWLAAAVLLP